MRTLAFLFLVTSCTMQEEVLPECDNASYTVKDDWLHLQIKSSSEYIMVCPEGLQCTKVSSRYFGCMMYRNGIGQFEIIDNGQSCILKIK